MESFQLMQDLIMEIRLNLSETSLEISDFTKRIVTPLSETILGSKMRLNTLEEKQPHFVNYGFVI